MQRLGNFVFNFCEHGQFCCSRQSSRPCQTRMVVSKTLHHKSCLKMSLKIILTIARGTCSIFCRENVDVKPEDFLMLAMLILHVFFCSSVLYAFAHVFMMHIMITSRLRIVFLNLPCVDVACSQQHCSLLSLPLRVLCTWRPGKSTVADCELPACEWVCSL
jgi:hypothetical protein